MHLNILSFETVEQILTSKPAGITVINEYENARTLKDSTRRLMVNIIVSHMREKEGRAINKATKEFHALGIVSLFPPLKDPYSKKRICLFFLQDFLLMFGEEAASRFLEKWNTSFKEKVIQEARSLKGSTLLRKYLKAALNEESDTPEEPEWDTDMASLLVLLHLLTPQPAGRKRAKKISVEEATDHLVKFLKSCQSLEDHLLTTKVSNQPYLLATGTSKAQVSTFYVVLDKKLLPCQACTTLGAFDELFKSHFVFNVKYDDALSSLYTFLQTTVYNIDVGTTEETPRVHQYESPVHRPSRPHYI
ncbi:uncharacterized protein LOC112141726 [Oryzias melastigma]|uniref:uncharacterized protein LOC112141726 n=1 Tax=Oryzias melastigma TaxID=30732 RepID=UPI00168CAED4|nr:uncharacterized protein LOC112141726 [Oryzias melastigma]